MSVFGYHVMTFCGDRYSSIVWFTTREEAEEFLQKMKDEGIWKDMIPKIERGLGL